MAVSYPPLRPSNVMRHQPSMSDSGNLKVTTSLGSARGSIKSDVGTAATETARSCRDVAVTTTCQGSHHPNSNAYSLAAAPRGSASTHHPATLSHGHIGAYKNGSPMQRYDSTHRKPEVKTPIKFNRHSTRRLQVLQDNSLDENTTMKVDMEQTEDSIIVNKVKIDVSGSISTEIPTDESPFRSDVDRRYLKLGVGPTVRYSKDAREVLMGKSPNVNRPAWKTSSFDSDILLDGSPYPPLSLTSTKGVESRFQVGDNPVSRLNRPTAASTARTQESKTKIETRRYLASLEIKKPSEVRKGSQGIRSRVSDLFHGRCRSTQPVHKYSHTQVQLIKTGDIRDNAVKKIVTEVGEQVDKLVSDRDQQQSRTNHQETNRAKGISNTTHRHTRNPSPATCRDLSVNNEQPPPPPINGTEFLRTHYLEDATAALHTEDARLEAALAGVQSSLDEIIATTQDINYPGFRAVVEPVIRSLAASILSAQNARVAVIGLGNATQRVVTDTLIMSEGINRAAMQARVMVGDIQIMVPGVEASDAD
ncbi:hypothetical protein ONS95_012238 [Cadophora gregata]|nr:uncharacterized protein ONS95_012238 [Cadophora gregata]KAK0117925.1 hypothetical protein ONS95_012238 [Cadophora gregata]KAK0122985.1 hypothetical protein ONS96_010004 [Cadophora gregata f. sp. sojae]